MGKHQQVINALAENFTKKLPFIRQFKLEVLRCDAEEVVLKFPMQDALMGNFSQKILHGGVAATLIDNIGGLAMMVADVGRSDIETVEQCEARFAKACTIDLRIDYLRPGRGHFFTLKARAMRSGRRVQTVRMEMYSDEDKLIALGSGSYMLG